MKTGRLRFAGFSLLELLAALSITLIVALMAGALLNSQQAALRQARERAGLLDQQRIAATYLSRWLDRAVAPPQVVDASLLPPPWAADAVSPVLVFQAVTPDSGGGLPRTRAHGFWIAYSGDEPWRPGFIKATGSCFRLMHRMDGDAPAPCAIEAGDPAPWLTRHLQDAAAPVVPAAEHVLALVAGQGAPWGLQIVLTESAGWRRCDPGQRENLARDLRALASGASVEPGRIVRRSQAAHLTVRQVRLDWPDRWRAAQAQ